MGHRFWWTHPSLLSASSDCSRSYLRRRGTPSWCQGKGLLLWLRARAVLSAPLCRLWVWDPAGSLSRPSRCPAYRALGRPASARVFPASSLGGVPGFSRPRPAPPPPSFFLPTFLQPLPGCLHVEPASPGCLSRSPLLRAGAGSYLHFLVGVGGALWPRRLPLLLLGSATAWGEFSGCFFLQLLHPLAGLERR